MLVLHSTRSTAYINQSHNRGQILAGYNKHAQKTITIVLPLFENAQSQRTQQLAPPNDRNKSLVEISAGLNRKSDYRIYDCISEISLERGCSRKPFLAEPTTVNINLI